MCLQLKSEFTKSKTAEKDIIVYKWAKVANDALYTPYYVTEIVFNKPICSELIKDIDVITKGLHSFKHKTGALYDAYFLSFAIVECVIPAGATYYEGKYEDQVSYASDTIIFKKVVGCSKYARFSKKYPANFIVKLIQFLKF